MAGRHTRGSVDTGELLTRGEHDLCSCGHKGPHAMSRAELSSEAKGWRLVERAAAKLRVTLDARLNRATPTSVLDLARESGEPVLGHSWEEATMRRLGVEARRRCDCRCHRSKDNGHV